MLCEYGCGQKATHQFKNGKWCCSKNISFCPKIKNDISQKNKGNKHTKETIDKLSKCKMGFKNPRYGIKLDNSTKKKISEGNKGKIVTEKTRQLMSISQKGNKNRLGTKHTKETKNKLRIISLKRNKNPMMGKRHNDETKKLIGNKSKLTITKIYERYPFFCKIEEIRYNPDKPGEKEIQVHCKNHNCENSKEKDGWFTPSYIQLYERIRNIEHSGNGGCYFYCSEKCKNECPLYNLKSDPFQISNQYYTQEEYQQFREYVLKRDEYKCQYCDEKAVHVHHERPQKLEPFYSLDPDLAWSVCEKCHYKYGHKDECSTGQLANKIC